MNVASSWFPLKPGTLRHLLTDILEFVLISLEFDSFTHF